VESPVYDDSKWPLVIVTMPKQTMSAAAFTAFMDRISGFFEHGRFVLMIDARDMFMLNADQRRLIADRIDADDARYPGRVLAVAVLMSSAMQRGVFKAIKWLKRTNFEMSAFSDPAEAEVWLNTQLAQGALKRAR
jgi:hypothetical protein